MLHNPQIDRPDCHNQHGHHEHPSGKDMAQGTLAETNSRGSGKEPQSTTANVDNEHGRIDHMDFFPEVYVYRHSSVSSGQDGVELAEHVQIVPLGLSARVLAKTSRSIGDAATGSLRYERCDGCASILA